MLKKWGQYYLTTELSKKHSHSTYLASPIDEPERQIVLTVFTSSLFSFPREYEKLLQKAQRVKELEHPHLFPILDVGMVEGQPFVMREYVPYGSLRSHLRGKSPQGLELEDALSMLVQVGDALLYAHEHGIVHGKIKPENILFNASGQLVLTDFSFVDKKDVFVRDQASEEYAFCYMAPEQFAGVYDSRSDQYALGCLAYELIAGQVPFASQSLTTMMGRQRNEMPIPLSERVPGLPPALEVAILKTLNQDPEERFFDFSLFLEVVRSILSPPPAFPLLRSSYTHEYKNVSALKSENVNYSARRRSVKRTVFELAEQLSVSSGSEDHVSESKGTHFLVDTILPKSPEAISDPESLTSVLQSELLSSSPSLTPADLDNKENAIPDHPLKEHKSDEHTGFMTEIIPSAETSDARQAMTRLITEEEDELADLFREDDSFSGGIFASSVHGEDKPEVNKVTSMVKSNSDLFASSGRTRRSKRRSLGLVLLLSVIVAAISSGVWFSGIIPFNTTMHLSPSVNDETIANVNAVPTTISGLNLKALPTPASFSQNAAITGSHPNVEDANYTQAKTHSGYASNTVSASSNPSETNTASNPGASSTTSKPNGTNTTSNSGASSTTSKPSGTNTTSSPATTTSTANSDPYPPSGTLALDDPLNDNSKGYGWQESPAASSNGGWACQFIGGAYHAVETNQNGFDSCHAGTLQESNFALEVQMQIIQGSCGGIVLRDETSVAHAYSFQVCQDGSYQLYRFDGFSGGPTLQSGSSGAINTGLNQSNVIAAVANGGTFDLYVNHQKIASVNDSSYSRGQFGVSANGNSKAAYTNARMWTL